MDYNNELKIDYPVCMCDDIELYFNHYASYESAVESWEKRKKRINWNNIFVTMYTENPEIAKEFDQLDYEKKICFTTFASDLNSACALVFTDENVLKYKPLWYIVTCMASGILQCYDPVELLLRGRIK
jgi:uncharacterized protein (DUF1919 family)